MAEHYPSLVTHVIGVCTPYVPAAQEYRPLEEIVKSAPQLGYQLQLSRGELERAVDSKEKISQLLSGAFGGMTDRGEPIFDMFKGFRTDLLGKFGPPRLMDEKVGLRWAVLPFGLCGFADAGGVDVEVLHGAVRPERGPRFW